MRKVVWGFVTGVMIASVFSLYALDYYIMKPGNAHNASEYLEISGGDKDIGTFNFMTVSMSQATPLSYVLSQFQHHQKILKIEQVRDLNESDEEYNTRQLQLMKDSQFNAKLVAFQKAKKPYKVKYAGLIVMNVLDNGASDGILKTGDLIIAVNDQQLQRTKDLSTILSKKKKGDKLTFRIIRAKEKLHVQVPLKRIPGSNSKRVGLGITLKESKTIQTTPSVKITTSDIGGPSAGLMFTLEILNQLMAEDLTKGKKIAGTGEMLEDGTVGRIGGIDMKVIAADKQGMDIFFAPDDTIPKELKSDNPSIQSNYKTAVETAKVIDSDMQIVPVKTIDDALLFLQNLQ